MVKLDFVKPTDEFIQFIADNMWHEDVDEVMAAGNESPLDSLIKAVEGSDACVVACYKGVPLVIYGLARPTILGKTGVPWMLTTTLSKQYKKEFMVYTRRVIKEMFDECDELINYVHIKNKTSIKWLKALGFTISDPITNPKTAEQFCKFHLMRDSHV